MRFALTDEQTRLRAAPSTTCCPKADTAAVHRAWADGDHEPGLKLWPRLADLGVTVLATEATPVEVCVAFEALGRHAVPGPWVESAAYLPLALPGRETSPRSEPPSPPMPYALDADVCRRGLRRSTAACIAPKPATACQSIDRSRHARSVVEPVETTPVESTTLDAAFDLAALATSAQLLGARRATARPTPSPTRSSASSSAARSARTRRSSTSSPTCASPSTSPGRWSTARRSTPTPRSVSAAKVQSAEAADLAARVGLQVHGAIGYTDEYDLSLWLLRIRALQAAWGTTAFHRDRLLADLLDAR